MSRALEKDIAASINAANPSDAFDQISSALTRRQGPGLLEIEILGRSHAFELGTCVLRDENALGISKIGLVQAFFTARQILMGHLKDHSILPSEALLAVTSVILLMDPEHLTAANTRKKLILSDKTSADQTASRIQRDMFFIDSLLTSRLHRHTKSPTLWNHRRWLVDVSQKHGLQTDVLSDLTRVVMVAGERHPRNYYAWCHARFLTTLGLSSGTSEKLLLTTKEWCFRNHTDISGWSFLYYSLLTLDNTTSAGKEACRAVFAETAHLASSLHWTNESVWVFLRTLVASGAVGSEEVAVFHETASQLQDLGLDAGPKRVLEAARAWGETHQCRS